MMSIKDHPFYKKLKAYAEEPHRNLESRRLSKRIVATDVTREEYVEYLEAMLEVTASAETFFPALQTIIPDIDSRRKTGLLQADIQLLTGTLAKPNSTDLFADNRSSELPFQLGIVYVTEGSTLGGQYILKNIRKNLPEQEAKATQFLNCYEGTVGSSWQSFLIYLVQYSDSISDDQQQLILDGAAYAFTQVDEVFRRESVL